MESMEWTNWQANLETIAKRFFVFAYLIEIFGNISRDELMKQAEIYCGDIFYIKDEDNHYTDTWNNTYFPAMLKLCMFFEEKNEGEKKVYLTDAGKDLLYQKVRVKDFFKRQILEYQYYNPKTKGRIPENNLFPYWIILKFLKELIYIDEREAKHGILNISHYDELKIEERILLIKKSREESWNHDKFSKEFITKFGEKSKKAKAWQYERNFMFWSGLAIKDDEHKNAIRVNDNKKIEIDQILSKYPEYKNYSEKEWINEKGRRFIKNHEKEDKKKEKLKVKFFNQNDIDIYEDYLIFKKKDEVNLNDLIFIENKPYLYKIKYKAGSKYYIQVIGSKLKGMN